MLKTDNCAGHQVIQSSGNGYHQSMPPAKKPPVYRIYMSINFYGGFFAWGFQRFNLSGWKFKREIISAF